MRRATIRAVPVLWTLCACLLLSPLAADAGDTSLAVDFDGDGRHDSVRLDHDRPSVLHIWLSASNTTQVLVARRPLHHVAARDLDGDRRPELIASDSQSRIHVWTRLARGFRQYQPRRAIPRALSSPSTDRVDGRNREPEEAFTGGVFGPPELARTVLLPAPDRAVSLRVPPCGSSCPAFPALGRVFPRPPPPTQPRFRSVRRQA